MDEKCKLLAIQNELQQLHDTLPQAVSNMSYIGGMVDCVIVQYYAK